MCAQLCLTLCDPVGHSLPDFSICGIFQARILEWVAISYSSDPGIETTSLGASALVGGFFTTAPPRKPLNNNWRCANNLQNHTAIGKLSYHPCCQIPITLNCYWIHDSASSYTECPKRHLSYCRTLPLKMSNLGFTALIIRQTCCCLVAKLCWLCHDPMDCRAPGFPARHCLLEFAQTHVYWVGDAIQPSHPLLPPLLLYHLCNLVCRDRVPVYGLHECVCVCVCIKHHFCS